MINLINKQGAKMTVQEEKVVKIPFYKKWPFWVVSIYLLIVGIYTLSLILSEGNNRLLNSNELGDFLAGVFAPLAFLFLYLGYLQQGNALKKSNDHLSEQLKQQNRLISLQESERKEREHAAQPIFDLEIKRSLAPELRYDKETNDFKSVPNTRGLFIDINIKNTGEKISSIILRFSGDLNCILGQYTSMDTNQDINAAYIIGNDKIEFINKSTIDLKLEIEYKTNLGWRYLRSYSISLDTKNNDYSYDYEADYLRIDQVHPVFSNQS